MAKAKTKKSEKLTAEELEKVKSLQNQINNVLLNIGNQELIKNELTSKHAELASDWKEMSASLEKKYGSVNISLDDGTISEVKEEQPQTS